MQFYPLLLLTFLALSLFGVNAESAENEVEKRRLKNGRPMNPYSWERGKREVDNAGLEDSESVAYMPLFTNKRAYRRNPYSWQRASAFDSDQSGFFDTLFGAVKDKKSPYLMGYGNGRRARNPYSWQNFI
ncbi:hypothetical protein M3Y97_00075800 [Aphelenchoides bicaudatus]|nr:hypothetical protein M3Y97_00075800 [Aphelenchoides bicaudatus]